MLVEPTYLYIKQHTITGKLYFGKTARNPEKYLGSGKWWVRHIKKHGKEHVVNLWYELFTDKSEIIEFALSFSRDMNIVESTQWLNLIPENGLDGLPSGKYNPNYGIHQTIEHAAKRGISQSKWIKNNPELHIDRMNKINKNPDKIEKTAAKHRGMKRSIDTRLKLSLNSATKGKRARNNGKILAYNPDTNKHKWFNSVNEIPTTWNTGMLNKSGPKRGSKCFNNGIKNQMFVVDPGEEWKLGRLKL